MEFEVCDIYSFNAQNDIGISLQHALYYEFMFTEIRSKFVVSETTLQAEYNYGT